MPHACLVAALVVLLAAVGARAECYENYPAKRTLCDYVYAPFGGSLSGNQLAAGSADGGWALLFDGGNPRIVYAATRGAPAQVKYKLLPTPLKYPGCASWVPVLLAKDAKRVRPAGHGIEHISINCNSSAGKPYLVLQAGINTVDIRFESLKYFKISAELPSPTFGSGPVDPSDVPVGEGLIVPPGLLSGVKVGLSGPLTIWTFKQPAKCSLTLPPGGIFFHPSKKTQNSPLVFACKDAAGKPVPIFPTKEWMTVTVKKGSPFAVRTDSFVKTVTYANMTIWLTVSRKARGTITATYAGVSATLVINVVDMIPLITSKCRLDTTKVKTSVEPGNSFGTVQLLCQMPGVRYWGKPEINLLDFVPNLVTATSSAPAIAAVTTVGNSWQIKALKEGIANITFKYKLVNFTLNLRTFPVRCDLGPVYQNVYAPTGLETDITQEPTFLLSFQCNLTDGLPFIYNGSVGFAAIVEDECYPKHLKCGWVENPSPMSTLCPTSYLTPAGTYEVSCPIQLDYDEGSWKVWASGAIIDVLPSG